MYDLSRSTATYLGRELLPHSSDASGCLVSRDHFIFRYRYLDGQLLPICRLPPAADGVLSQLKDVLARSPLRLRWFPGPGLEHVVSVDDTTTLIVYDKIYIHRADSDGAPAKAVAWRDSRPLYTPLRGGVAVHAISRKAYFGEYLNGRKLGVRIYRVDAIRGQVEVCWNFSGSEAKHVHSVHYDRYRNRLWVCTGDLDHESAIYYTDDEFVTLHKLGGGDQTWRAIALLFDEGGVEWGMDAGKDAPAEAINHIYRFDFSSGHRSVQATVGNPVYAACDFEDGTAVMATSFEPGRKQATPSEAALWRRGADRRWQKVFVLDFAPSHRKGIGEYAHLLLPKGVMPSGAAFFTPVNTQKHNCHFLKLSL